MNARSALFDVYGDHLAGRRGEAPVAALVRLLAPLDVGAPAVRTVISRMVRQGWLRPVRLGAGPGYALTPRAERRLSEAAGRIYRTGPADWDGRWHLLVVYPPRDRSARERLRSGLRFLGYGALDDSTWVSPRASAEVDALLTGEGSRAERFSAGHDGDSAALVRRAWDLDGLARAYRRWLEEATELMAEAVDGDDESAYATRTRLVHEWRKFLFLDPGLPDGLLPDDWPGRTAAAFFDDHARRLLPAAGRYVDRCLGPRRSEER